MKYVFLFLSVLFFTCQSLAEVMCTVTDYFAQYEINTYECEVGEFLPANTLGCRTCPSGSMCPGGTFDFNPSIYQGLIFSIKEETLNNVCADNLPAYVYAVYAPNTITLNWDYKDGKTSMIQTQCTYDAPIMLPLDPVRQGYKFMGWRIKNDE